MNIRQVEIFRAVMETGSVTGAGERLRISQPSVSKYLRLLEESIGVALFERSGNRLTPTAEGRALFEQIDLHYRGLDHIRRFAAGLKSHPAGEIAIAAMPMLAQRWLPELLEPFLRHHEKLSIALPIRSSRWIADAIATGQVDIGVGLMVQDPVGVVQEPLMTVPLVCAMPRDHPFSGKGRVVPADLASQTLITLSNFDQWRLAVETAMEDRAVQPLRRVDTFTTQVACELAARGIGVAIVDLLTVLDHPSADLAWRPFDPAMGFEIALMRSRHRTLSRLASGLADTIRQAAAETMARLDASGR